MQTEQQVLTDIWTAETLVKEYGYWDSVDKPDGISETEWDVREAEWNEAIKKNSAFVRTFVSKDSIPYFEPKEYLPFFLSPEARVRDRACEVLFDKEYWVEYKAKLTPEEIEDEKESHGYHYAVRAMSSFTEWLLTPEGKNRLQDKINSLAAGKLKTFTVTDILGWTPKEET